MQSYFIPKEGFLAGLTLNRENVTLNPQYENILRYYGYDLESFNNPLYPDPLTTTTPAVMRDETSEPPASPVQPPTVTESVSTVSTPIPQPPVTETIPRETTTTQLPQTTTSSSPSTRSTSETLPTTTTAINNGEVTTEAAEKEVTDSMSTSTTQQPEQQDESEESEESEESLTTKREVSSTMNAVTTVAMDATTSRGTTTTFAVPTETTIASDAETTSKATSEGTTHSEVIDSASDIVTAASTPEGVDETTPSSGITSTTSATVTAQMSSSTAQISTTTARSPTETTTASSETTTFLTTETAIEDITTEVTTISADEEEQEEESTINLAISTDGTTTTMYPISDSFTSTTETTSSATADTETTETTEASEYSSTQQITTSTANMETTTTNMRVVPMSKFIRAIKFKEKARKPRSIIDYIIARQLDKYYNPSDEIYHRKSTYIPQRPLTFLVDGKYMESNINFMTYDTVLPFHYVPSLRASALSFPLDSTQYYLLLILPDRPDGVDELICDMKRASDLKYVIRNLKYRRVKAVIPSFMLRGYVNLTPTLQKVGTTQKQNFTCFFGGNV